ncbi:DUF4428 domain-containing protein [Lactobacillus bombicola]|uniref:DUF4428 domain-containing protein n=1 Tax=Lactobacillus bombicola TaxID=1505723 RepID=A0ABX9LV57_9LACO|nr:DUF4428 domain-containing protein [Lactobacillus bombicola]RHW51081.1 hypothetical protein DS833_03760 [Lactobacillus bombicola]RHW52654.1 hypothetical protein DS834_01815 [Lactobacillus bombicola]
MAKKKCGICGKQLGFWDGKYPVKDGVICNYCFEKGDFYEGTAQKNIRKFLDTQTAAEIKILIDNPEKLEAIKQKVAPKKHHLPPMAQSAFCGTDIYHGDDPLKFKNSEYLCRNCMAKYKFSSTRDPILWADNHTVEDFKKYIDQGKDFSDIELEIEQQRQKRSAEKESEKLLLSKRNLFAIPIITSIELKEKFILARHF